MSDILTDLEKLTASGGVEGYKGPISEEQAHSYIAAREPYPLGIHVFRITGLRLGNKAKNHNFLILVGDAEDEQGHAFPRDVLLSSFPQYRPPVGSKLSDAEKAAHAPNYSGLYGWLKASGFAGTFGDLPHGDPRALLGLALQYVGKPFKARVDWKYRDFSAPKEEKALYPYARKVPQELWVAGKPPSRVPHPQDPERILAAEEFINEFLF